MEFYKIDNIFTTKERKKIIEIINPHLKKKYLYNKFSIYKEPDFPGKQTDFDLFKSSQLEFLYSHILKRIKEETNLKVTIQRSWANWSNGKSGDMNIKDWIKYYFKKTIPLDVYRESKGFPINLRGPLWHDHHEWDYSLIYYLQTTPFVNDGTLFKNGMIRSPQNSLIIFPGNQLHASPPYLFGFKRYTLSIDFMKV